jgi:hypothetical protein
MRELAIAGVWLFVAVSLFMIEPEVRGDFWPYVAHGKWVALVLAIMNALRLPLKWSVKWLLRRFGGLPSQPKQADAPPPVLHPEFQITDDPASPPGPLRP